MKAADMRSLSHPARFARRVEVIELRRAGLSYVQIALKVGLSRTGVFDICKRHTALGIASLHDAPAGRGPGVGRRLGPAQEALLRDQIVDHTPDELEMPEPLWDRAAVSRLIDRRLGIVLPVRTLASYLARWGFAARRPEVGAAGRGSRRLNRWLKDRYPGIVAKSRAEGGEIAWGSDSTLRGPARSPAPPANLAAPRRGRHGLPRERSILSALNSRGQLRWTGFDPPLSARILLAFLRRLIQGADRKVFLIMEGWRTPDGGLVHTWLLEHEDAIEAFHVPGRRRSGR